MIRDSSGKEVVGWFVLSLVQPFLYLFDAKTTTVEKISLFKLICSKNDGLIYLIVLPVGKLHLVRETFSKTESFSKLEDYSVGYKTSDIGLKDYCPNIKVFITPWYSRVIRPLCKICSLMLEVDDFSIGYTLNFVSQLCGYDFLSS